MKNENIPLFWPVIYKDEWLEELGKVFDTRWIGQASKVEELEKEFGKKFDYDHCLSVNSGTAALELAYDLVGIKKDDVVLSTVLTCSATNIPIVRREANLNFIDVNRYTLCMDYVDLLDKVNYYHKHKPVKAIVVVNLGGISFDDRIYELAKKHGIPVIVDACQSLGVTEPKGDYVAYSFQAIKHFSTGDGGMLVVRNQEDYDRAKKLRWFGIDRNAKSGNNWSTFKSDREICMDMEEPGWKFHMNDIAAVMGLVGLRHSDEILKHRKNIAKIYREGLRMPTVTDGSHWLFGVFVEDNITFIEKMREKGVECDVAHLRNDIFTLFGGARQSLVNMNQLESQYCYLPLNTKVTEEDAKYVIKCIGELT
jgi:perosamine synthetase